MRIRTKNSFADLIDNKKCKTVVEIGAGTGEYSKFLLENTKIKQLICIDKWEEWKEDAHDNRFHYQDKEGNKRHDKFSENTKGFVKDNLITEMHMDSIEAAKKIDDNSLDALCIDGDVTEDGLLADLKAWLPKVKTDGLIFGLRYGEEVDSEMYKNTAKKRYRKVNKSNTKKILDFFAQQNSYELQISTRGDVRCWYFFKKPSINRIEKDVLDLEVCIHTHHYQRRLCWMLSSILQQKGNPPNITISISHSENDGTPTTREVCDFFRGKGLNIKEYILNDKEVRNRAIGRNLQVKNTAADWMLFADSDMVYDPYFFDDLHSQIKASLAAETRCVGADRVSLDIPFCIKHFEEDKTEYPCVIENVADICAQWPVKWVTGKKTAPGNFQLANTQAIVMRGGVYSGREGDVWRHTKSDRHFRVRMGGRCSMEVKAQYHLNHDRGGPEIQR